MMQHCPEGWFYGEMPNDDSESPLEDTIVVAVCSVECRDQFFKPGPGNLNESPDYIRAARELEKIDG